MNLVTIINNHRSTVTTIRTTEMLTREHVDLVIASRFLSAGISALDYRPWQCYNGLIIAQEYGSAHKLRQRQ